MHKPADSKPALWIPFSNGLEMQEGPIITPEPPTERGSEVASFRRFCALKPLSGWPSGLFWCSGQRRANTVVMEFTHRVATTDDLVMLEAVMDAVISELQQGFLSPEEIESSRAIMGIDTQLITDGTYYVVLAGEGIAGCGGWSRRATLYGGDHIPGRDPEPLDPAVDAARVRAMYTNPATRAVGWAG